MTYPVCVSNHRFEEMFLCRKLATIPIAVSRKCDYVESLLLDLSPILIHPFILASSYLLLLLSLVLLVISFTYSSIYTYKTVHLKNLQDSSQEM